jgi:hypothetical protein
MDNEAEVVQVQDVESQEVIELPMDMLGQVGGGTGNVTI